MSLTTITTVGRRGALVGVLAALALAHTAVPGGAQGIPFNPTKDIGLDQKLNAPVPRDVAFRDETGKSVRLGDYLGKRPFILNLVFYQCMGTCTLELEGMVKSFRKMPETIGKDFDVVTVSIHPRETPALAASKKETFMQIYKRPEGQQGWHFLTGTQEEIQKLAKAIGFRYTYDPATDQIAHPAGIMIVTPDGRLSRYFYGVSYPNKLVSTALADAGKNRIASEPAEVVLLGCLQYNSKSRSFTVKVVNLLKVLGVGTVLILATSIVIMSLGNRRQALNAPKNPATPNLR